MHSLIQGWNHQRRERALTQAVAEDGYDAAMNRGRTTSRVETPDETPTQTDTEKEQND